MDWLTARTAAGEVALDPAVGNLRRLVLRDGDREIAPLHTAPWIGEGGDLSHLPPVERTLAGDFFCAPFGPSDVEPSPPHGWPANSAWQAEDASADTVAAALGRTVMGARMRKRLRLSAEAPLLFQEHWIDGGEGGLTVAHHPMVRLAGGGRFFTSPKRLAITPDAPLEPGRSALRYPATGPVDAVPGARGPVDLTRLPIGERTEDFVTLVEAPGRSLGWSAVLREAEDDIVFFVKDPRVLPVTMLWHSNGGRDGPPWNGRHRGVLGVEDGIAWGVAGHRAALGETPLSAMGVATALPLAPGRTHRIAHAIGAVARRGWQDVSDIRVDGEALTLVSGSGDRRRLPIEAGFF